MKREVGGRRRSWALVYITMLYQLLRLWLQMIKRKGYKEAVTVHLKVLARNLPETLRKIIKHPHG